MAKKKAESKEKPTLSTVPDALPKGITQEMYDEVKTTILSGFEANQSPDAIKSAIFNSGVPFSKLNRLYSIITKAEGLVIDPKIISEGIKSGISALTFSFEETYEVLAGFAADIAEEVNGATTASVLTKMKAVFKENEAEFPRKPAPTRGRMGTINKTLIDVFKADSKATQDDCYNALVPVVKTLKNADDYAKMYHKMLYAVANGMSTLEVLTHFSEDAK